MRNLINFIIKYASWFIFIFYVVISCTLLFQFNSFQHHIYLTSANSISSWVYGGMSNVTSYFHLKEINNDLQTRNALLEMEIVDLKHQLKDFNTALYSDTVIVPQSLSGYEFIISQVINNSISKPYNYITLDKGSEDGLVPEMGIVDQNGVVGIINVVGKHSSRAISLLNPNFKLSCKVKDQDYFGSLVWGGNDHSVAYLEEMPRHVQFNQGDTIVTSGYSAVFPEGLIVGTIIDSEKSDNDNFFSLKVKLSTDFSKLSTVRVLKNNNKEELDELEIKVAK